jgi:tRNA dimethylallyltransferase
MSLYRGMDIGTAKPSAGDRARVPHHLLDLVDPHEEFSVAEYVSRAEAACTDIVNRGRVPLFVGGTGLYLRSLLRGIFEGPPADWKLRRRLMNEAQGQGAAWLHDQLSRVDPETARRLHPNDERRIIRAIEIHELTGQPASMLRDQTPLPTDQRPRHVYWLSPARKWLHDRINARVDQMIAAGWVEEVRRLLHSPQGIGRTASQALGYKELIAHLKGACSLTEAVEQIKAATRQFAKRQHTWFRQLEECIAIPMTGSESPQDLADRLMHHETELHATP